MEQQLINQLFCFIRKAGGASFVNDLLVPGSDVTHKWTADEMKRAVDHLQWINNIFAQSDASVVISKLLEMYQIDVKDLSLKPFDR